MENHNIINLIKSLRDPVIAWVWAEADICDAVLFRLCSKYPEKTKKIQKPEATEEYIFGGEGADASGVYVFEDGSLYEFSNGEPSAWADAQDYAAEYQYDFEDNFEEGDQHAADIKAFFAKYGVNFLTE